MNSVQRKQFQLSRAFWESWYPWGGELSRERKRDVMSGKAIGMEIQKTWNLVSIVPETLGPSRESFNLSKSQFWYT